MRTHNTRSQKVRLWFCDFPGPIETYFSTQCYFSALLRLKIRLNSIPFWLFFRKCYIEMINLRQTLKPYLLKIEFSHGDGIRHASFADTKWIVGYESAAFHPASPFHHSVCSFVFRNGQPSNKQHWAIKAKLGNTPQHIMSEEAPTKETLQRRTVPRRWQLHIIHHSKFKRFWKQVQRLRIFTSMTLMLKPT